jgi:AcrR family transcriptional regulator
MVEAARVRRRAPRRVGGERKTYRKQPTQARARATVDVILDAARMVLVQDGYEKLSTNRVARIAGVSIGSLYQYFPGKRALIGALLERHIERIRGDLRAGRPAFDSLPVEQRIRRLTEWMVESHRSDPELHRIIVLELPRLGLAPQTIALGFEQAIARTTTYLEAHADEIAPRNHALSAFIVVHTIESLTKAAIARDPQMLGPELIDEITLLLTRYLKPGAAQEPR